MSARLDRRGAAEVRWASRVNPSLVRRLYENDAWGLVDEQLIVLEKAIDRVVYPVVSQVVCALNHL